MKVPYLKKKRSNELNLLGRELVRAIVPFLKKDQLSSRTNCIWCSKMYSLFAIVELLLSDLNQSNPSRQYALEGARNSKNRSLFISALSAFSGPPEIMAAMRKAYSRTIFTGFIAELRSDLLLVFAQMLICSYRGAAIGLRCALEDLYRHLYYMDHPEEYSFVVAGDGAEHAIKLSPMFFREYLARTSYLGRFKGVDESFLKKTDDSASDIFTVNEELYRSLSQAVHGASTSWHAALGSFNALAFSKEKDEHLTKLTGMFCEMAVIMLLSAHREIFMSANDYDRSLILDVLPPAKRHALRAFLDI